MDDKVCNITGHKEERLHSELESIGLFDIKLPAWMFLIYVFILFQTFKNWEVIVFCGERNGKDNLSGRNDNF